MSEANQAQQTIKDLQIQVQSLQSQLRQSHSVNEQLSRLQQAIARMYLEFADRTSEAFQKQQAETFEQLMQESPLVVLDRLRAQLRILLAFREDFEAQLQIDVESTNQVSQTQRKDMQTKLLDAQDKIFQLKQELSKAKSDINAYEQQLMDAQRAAQDDQQAIKKRVELLEAQKIKQTEEITRQKTKIERSNQLMKNQDLKLARISELEAKLQQKETEFQSRIAKVQTLDRNEIIRLQKEIANYKQIGAENMQLKQLISQLSAELASYKSNVKTIKYAEACQQIQHLQRAEQDLRQQVDKLQTTLSRTENDKICAEQSLKQAQAQIRSLEDDSAKQLQAQLGHKANAMQQGQVSSFSGQQNTQLQASAPQYAIGSAAGFTQQQNALLNQAEGGLQSQFRQQKQLRQQVLAQHELQTALDKLRERDREIEELAKRVRKLLALQHKTALSQKAFLEEKQQLERQIQQLRDENAAFRKAQGSTNVMQSKFANSMGTTAQIATSKQIANAQEAAQRAQEELLRDVQNLRAYAITASASATHSARHAPQQLAELEDVEECENIVFRKLQNADLRPGRGGGYGAGSMLGTRVKSAGFGLV